MGHKNIFCSMLQDMVLYLSYATGLLAKDQQFSGYHFLETVIDKMSNRPVDQLNYKISETFF